MIRFLVVTGLLLLTSCASSLPPDYKAEHGTRYVTASWYGSKFHGRQTASGERYDMYGFTAAHKTLKFGTKLRVTNPDSNKSVIVTVNDRGPFIRGRDLDLSYGAAREIGLVAKGVGQVKIEYVDRDVRYVKRVPFIAPRAPSRSLTVQVGSFTESSRAFRLKQGLDYAYDDVYVTSVVLKGRKYYRVKVGKFDEYSRAYAVAEKLADEGYSTLVVTTD